MQVKVDPDLCRGHGRCQALAPDAFRYDEKTDQSVPSDEFATVPLDRLRAAVSACPERAITLVEDPQEENR